MNDLPQQTTAQHEIERRLALIVASDNWLRACEQAVDQAAQSYERWTVEDILRREG